jgi:hypothetical protein
MNIEQQVTTELHGTAFYVDVDSGILIEKENADNVIELYELQSKDGHYHLDFDTIQKNEAFDSNTDAVRLSVPHMVKLAPEQVAYKYGIPVSKLPLSDDLLVCNKADLIMRIGGALPKIHIYDYDFIVDIRMRSLRPIDDFSTMGIPLDRLEPNPSDTRLFFFYDIKKHTDVPFSEMNHNMTDYPKNIVPMEIPMEKVLDSIAFGRMAGYDQLSSYPFGKDHEAVIDSWKDSRLMDLINRYPIRSNLAARKMKWEDTVIPSLIEENRKRFKKQPKPSKGKGI